MSKSRVVLCENPWRLVLFDEEGRHLYEIDLHECTTSAEVLDWIAQICTKGWGSDELIGMTTRALSHILDLQANYCSGGSDLTSKNPVDIEKVVPEQIGFYVMSMEGAERPLKEEGRTLDMDDIMNYPNELQEVKERAYRGESKYFEPT